MHIFVEQPIQEALLSARWLIHAPQRVLRHPALRHHRRPARSGCTTTATPPTGGCATCSGITTGLALIGYWAFPLAPPRLLKWHGFVDTLDTIGGLWSYNSPVAKAVANPFAAMPSLHFGWALWCGMVFWTLTSNRWARAMAFIYPFLTLSAIVITANHYFLDAVGGAIVFGAALLIQNAWERSMARRHAKSVDRPVAEAAGSAPPGADAEELGGVTTR